MTTAFEGRFAARTAASNGLSSVRGLALTVPAVLGTIALAVFLLTRVTLALWSIAVVPWSYWPYAFLRGFWFDLVTAGVMLAPFLLVNAVMPEAVRRTRAHAWLVRGATLAFVTLLLVAAIGELLFWDEFATRFNFIAVDYLVYTQEVLANIFQSYPVKSLFAGVCGLGMLIVWFCRRWLRAIDATPTPLRTRLIMVALSVAMPALALVMPATLFARSGNAYADEIAGNGLYTLVDAFFSSELDYDRFYSTLPEARARAVLAATGSGRVAPPQDMATPPYLLRRPKNVVLVTVESLSAEYLGVLGSREQLTPRLDRIASQGMLFTRFFASGTRTVRGLEATSLGTPPVPGQAILHRPAAVNLATVGATLRHAGYDTAFSYGGDAFFDSMRRYFGRNGYEVFDKGEFPEASIAFENAWGVADESLFANVLGRLDAQQASGRPFFMQVMTTSNHRPFTYPDGRIDIPSPGGRDGAVKYTDYAIGHFLEEAAARPWFRDTLFVIVADHCASVAGKVELPVEKYRIPLILYGPGIIKPGRYEAVASQIDLPPTLLRLLGVPGEGLFFGRALVDTTSEAGDRAFISTYQSLGYLKDNLLTVLKPRKVVEAFRVDPLTLETIPATIDPALRDEAIAYYQSASHEYASGALRAPWPTASQ